MRHFARIATSVLTSALISTLVIVAMPLQAGIEFGPWRFENGAFADDATQLDAGETNEHCAADIDEALTGFSPGKLLINIGFDDNAASFMLEFTGLTAVNANGPDIVFFEADFSAITGYEIAVRPAGGEFTSPLAFDESDFIITGETDHCVFDYGLRGLPLEMDDFGLPAGAAVDAFRFTATSSDPDPVMAGALNFEVVFADGFEQ